MANLINLSFFLVVVTTQTDNVGSHGGCPPSVHPADHRRHKLPRGQEIHRVQATKGRRRKMHLKRDDLYIVLYRAFTGPELGPPNQPGDSEGLWQI